MLTPDGEMLRTLWSGSVVDIIAKKDQMQTECNPSHLYSTLSTGQNVAFTKTRSTTSDMRKTMVVLGLSVKQAPLLSPFPSARKVALHFRHRPRIRDDCAFSRTLSWFLQRNMAFLS